MAMYAQSSNQSQSTGNLLSQKPSSHRSNYHPSSGAVSSKKYNAFFSDEDSPRSYRTKHYSDDEDSYSDDDSYDYSRSAARQREANYSSRKSSGLRQSSANKNGYVYFVICSNFFFLLLVLLFLWFHSNIFHFNSTLRLLEKRILKNRSGSAVFIFLVLASVKRAGSKTLILIYFYFSLVCNTTELVPKNSPIDLQLPSSHPAHSLLLLIGVKMLVFQPK